MKRTGKLHIKLKEYEKEYIKLAYEDNDYNQSETARDLGISRTALIYKLKEYGLLDKYS